MGVVFYLHREDLYLYYDDFDREVYPMKEAKVYSTVKNYLIECFRNHHEPEDEICITNSFVLCFANLFKSKQYLFKVFKNPSFIDAVESGLNGKGEMSIPDFVRFDILRGAATFDDL